MVGGARDFLGKRGWGWLMEESPQDEDDDLGPLAEELEIDPKQILDKMKLILRPTAVDRHVLLESHDFWGPFCVILGLSTLYLTRWVFTVWIAGTFGIFLLIRSLGGSVSFSGTLCVVGYSSIPLVAGAGFASLTRLQSGVILRLVDLGTLGWSCFSAGSVLAPESALPKKQALALYPILLLYLNMLSLRFGV